MDMKRMRELAGVDSVRPGLSGTTESALDLLKAADVDPDNAKHARKLAHDPRDSMPASDYYKKLDTKSWVKAAEKEKGAATKTPANKGPKLKGKALDKAIEKSYYKLGHGVQIDIMDIDKVFKMGQASYEKDGDIEAGLVAAIKQFRKN